MDESNNKGINSNIDKIIISNITNSEEYTMKHGFLSLLFFVYKLHIYAKLNCLKWNYFDI